MTGLEEMVRTAVAVLTDLSSARTSRAAADAALATAAGEHGLRVRMVTDEEDYDGSLHHDVIIREPGGPTVSLSVATGTGLPWALRGLARQREYDLVEVDGEIVTVDQAMACVDGIFDDVRLLRGIVDSCLVAQAFDELGLSLTAADLQAASEAFRRARRLYSAAATAAWMADKGFTPDLLAKHVEQHAMVALLRRHVVGAEVQGWLERHAGELDTVVIAWVADPDGGPALRADPTAAVTAAWRAGAAAGLDRWRVADLPAGFTGLRSATSGDLVRVEHDGVAGCALVVDRRAAAPDAATLARVERRLFDGWLRRRRAAARVTWFWGDRRRTQRVCDASP